MGKTPETRFTLKPHLLQLVETTCPSLVIVGKSPSLAAGGTGLRLGKGTSDCKPETVLEMMLCVERR